MEDKDKAFIKKDFYIKSPLTEKLYLKKSEVSPIRQAAIVITVLFLGYLIILWMLHLKNMYMESQDSRGRTTVIITAAVFGPIIFYHFIKVFDPAFRILIQNVRKFKNPGTKVYTYIPWNFKDEEDKILFKNKKEETFEKIKEEFKNFLKKENESYPRIREFSVSEDTEIKDEFSGKTVILRAHEIYNMTTDIEFYDSPLIYDNITEHNEKYPKIRMIHETEGIKPTEHSFGKIKYDFKEEEDFEKITEKYNNKHNQKGNLKDGI